MKVYLILVNEVAILINELQSEGYNEVEKNAGVNNLKVWGILL